MVALATIEACPALPSRCNTSHGNATIETPSPAAAISVANRIRNAGPRLLFLMNIAAESSAKPVWGPPNFCAAAARMQDVRVLMHPKTGRAFRSPVEPGSGWPGDPATPQTPVAADAAQVSALAGGAGSICELNALISVCRACPRLVSWREEVAVVKRRAFADQPYWGARCRGGVEAAAVADPRAGARRAQGQPDRTNVHRRSVGRSALCSTA